MTQAEKVRWLPTRKFLQENPDLHRKSLLAKREELGAIKLGKSLYWREDALERYAERLSQQQRRRS